VLLQLPVCGAGALQQQRQVVAEGELVASHAEARAEEQRASGIASAGAAMAAVGEVTTYNAMCVLQLLPAQ
jgi:hypothetical protein